MKLLHLLAPASLVTLASLGCEVSAEGDATSGSTVDKPATKGCREIVADENPEGVSCMSEGEICEVGVGGTGGPLPIDIFTCEMVDGKLGWRKTSSKLVCLSLDPQCTESCCETGERCEQLHDQGWLVCVDGVWAPEP